MIVLMFLFETMPQIRIRIMFRKQGQELSVRVLLGAYVLVPKLQLGNALGLRSSASLAWGLDDCAVWSLRFRSWSFGDNRIPKPELGNEERPVRADARRRRAPKARFKLAWGNAPGIAVHNPPSAESATQLLAA
jgi:hypothetical protein